MLASHSRRAVGTKLWECGCQGNKASVKSCVVQDSASMYDVENGQVYGDAKKVVSCC
jgi:hypothetical protein